jgi:uncharacterized membrane protein
MFWVVIAVGIVLLTPISGLVYLAVNGSVWAGYGLGIITGIVIIWITNVIDWINDWLAGRAANQHMQTANQNMLNQQVGMMNKIAGGYANLLLAEDRRTKIESRQQPPIVVDYGEDLDDIEGL